MTDIENIPYNPQTRAQSFTQLTSEGMDADRAFVLLTIITANSSASILDGEHMAEIRGLVAGYAAFTGQESLLWAKS